MNWEDKTKMCSLANNIFDNETLKSFIDFAKENLDDIIADEQAHDMFLTGVQILKDEIALHIDFWKLYVSKTNHIEFGDMRTAFRQVLIEGVVNELIEES